jgi:hypothetical protein
MASTLRAYVRTREELTFSPIFVSVIVKIVCQGLDGAPSTEDAERWAGLLEAGNFEQLREQLAETAKAVSPLSTNARQEP